MHIDSRFRGASWYVALAGYTVFAALLFFALTPLAFAAEKVIFLTTTGSNTWTVPDDWTNTNTIEAIGGGGGGAGSDNRAGGGGGAYAKITNFSATPGGSVSYFVAAGGVNDEFDLNGASGGNTWFSAQSTLKAAGGAGGSSSAGAGGTTAASVGSVTYAGGAGAAGSGGDSGAGGGAAGPTGAGVNASGVVGGAGSNGDGGAGGTDGEGSAGAQWTQTSNSATAGAGGGGGYDDGGGLAYGGGLYGGGGAGFSGETGGSGRQGIIVITYTAADPAAPTVTTQAASSVTATTATANGTITATNLATPTTRGFAYGTVSTLATVIATTSASGSFSTGAFTGSLTSLSCETTYYVRAYATNSVGTGFGSIQSFTTGACDSDAPVISAIATSTTSTTATITWTTDEAASSLVRFGPTSSYGTTTREYDTSPRVTSHSVTIPLLQACVLYYYQVQSTDANSNTGTSDAGTFRTAGCSSNAPVVAQTQSDIATTTGGTVSEGKLLLTVPTGFTNASSTVTFQANKLDGETFFQTVEPPSGKRSAGSIVFNLTALADATTTVSSFAAALTVTFTYEESDVATVDPDSLIIYRYDDGEWTALSNCTVDTASRTVSCETTHFSDFALFGTEDTGRRNSIQVRGGGSGSAAQTATTATAAEREVITAVLRSIGIEQSAIDAVLNALWPSTATAGARDLELGATGEDVRALQQKLIAANQGPAAQALAAHGTTTLFGPLTRAALIEYQKAKGIVPAAGYFGPKTRAALGE